MMDILDEIGWAIKHYPDIDWKRPATKNLVAEVAHRQELLARCADEIRKMRGALGAIVAAREIARAVLPPSDSAED